MEDAISIFYTTDADQANLMKAHLESEEIFCFLKSDGAGGVLPHLMAANGVEIMVRQDDAERAVEILENSL